MVRDEDNLPLLVSDQETQELVRFALALNHFKHYIIGFEGLSKYIVAQSLDKTLLQTALKFAKFQKENLRDLKAYDIVRFLEKEDYFSRETAGKLKEYVDFSRVFLAGSSVSVNANSKAEEILRFLCSQIGLDFDREIDNMTFEDIATLRTQQLKSGEESKVVGSDFDNFESLYQKCPILQSEIENRLRNPLRHEEISYFSPNIGGIWLPFVTRQISEKKAHLRHASLGIAITPVDLRIGLDFGNLAHKARVKYYELLLNEELRAEFEILNSKDAGYVFCDTFWRYHIRNVGSLQWALGLYSYEKEKLRKDIEDTRRLEGETLTSNKHLICKVFVRGPDDFVGVLDRLVDEVSKTLDELYAIIELVEAAV